MYKKWILILCIMMFVCTTAVADEFLTPTDTQIYDCINSKYRMSIPQNDGSCYIMGKSVEQLQDWISYVSHDGTVKWTATCPASSYYSGAIQIDETIYVLVNEYGKPLEERKPYLLPIAVDGQQHAPIFLPSWTADAAIMNVDSGILVYSNSTAPLRIALFDPAFQVVWEIESSALPSNLYMITDCIQFGDEYILLAASREGQESGLVFIDQSGKNIETRIIHEDGFATAMTSDQSAIHLLLRTQEEENASFYMLTTNRAGDLNTKKTIISETADIALSDLFVVEHGYLFSGLRHYGREPSEVVLILKNFEEGKIQIQNIAEVKDTMMTQTHLLADHSIMVFGIHAGEDGQGDGRIICKKYVLLP